MKIYEYNQTTCAENATNNDNYNSLSRDYGQNLLEKEPDMAPFGLSDISFTLLPRKIGIYGLNQPLFSPLGFCQSLL